MVVVVEAVLKKASGHRAVITAVFSNMALVCVTNYFMHVEAFAASGYVKNLELIQFSFIKNPQKLWASQRA